MLKYSIKRILVFIPTLLVISFLAFGLSKMTPGDPVLSQMEEGLIITPKDYQQLAKGLNLDLPTFYFKFTSCAYPKELYTYTYKPKRKALSQLIAQYGNWPEIIAYSNQIDALNRTIVVLPKGIGSHAKSKVLPEIKLLSVKYKEKGILKKLKRIDGFLNEDTTISLEVKSAFQLLSTKYKNITDAPTINKLYWPTFYWYGSNNQYHKWFSRFLVGDFGVSTVDSQPVAKKLWPALKLTLLLNTLAIVLAYFLSIPLGVYLAIKQGQKVEKITSVFLFMLYSLPTFWVATMLIIFVTTPQYGMDWFPTLGLGDLPKGASSWEVFWDKAWHLVLPVFCLSYGALAYVSRHMKTAMVDVLNKDYIRTAKAKGLPYKKIIWKHAFRNSLFPIITMFATILPAAIAGSVVIEAIFNIHGMGWQIINAIDKEDWNVVYAILMLSSVLTMVGILLSDLLYARVDPRISLKK